MMRRAGVLLLAFVWLAMNGTSGLAQQAIARHGSCPSGFNSSGNYCVAISSDLHAIERHGSCPSGYNSSGDYCVRKGAGKQAIHRNGSCPSGYNSSGNYCVQNR